MLEIERKFLITGDAWKQAPSMLIRQGYLCLDPLRTVRVRIVGAQAKLTIKGETRGVSRPEFEYDLPLLDAEELLALCERPLIEKRRYRLSYQGSRWEVDEFLKENEGLVIAEIELPSEDAPFAKPDWVGEEVSSDPRYYNSNLAVHPFSAW